MNKLTHDEARGERVPGVPERPATAFADSWRQTESLEALRRATDASSRVRQVVSRAAGLSGSEMTTLEHLVRAPAGPAELARVLEVSTAAVTQIVDRLVGHGHVERRPHATDRRRTELVVTASGREEVLAHLLPMFRRLRELDEAFTDDERAVVARYLRGATEAFEEITGSAQARGRPGPSPRPGPTTG